MPLAQAVTTVVAQPRLMLANYIVWSISTHNPVSKKCGVEHATHFIIESFYQAMILHKIICF